MKLSDFCKTTLQACGRADPVSNSSDVKVKGHILPVIKLPILRSFKCFMGNGKKK